MINKQIEVKLNCELVTSGRYYLNGIRLHFDETWEVYIVNGDLYMPYYRIYINNEFKGVALYERQAYDFLLNAKTSLDIRM